MYLNASNNKREKTTSNTYDYTPQTQRVRTYALARIPPRVNPTT